MPENTNRIVFATDPTGWEIVRYDRAGKWFAERPQRRKRMTVQEAAKTAAMWRRSRSGEITFGLPGGSRFYFLVKRELEKNHA